MLQNKKSGTGALVLAGLAAFAYYKYSKMSEEQKRDLVGGLKEKGKKLFDQYMPSQVKDMFGKKENNSFTNNFTDGNTYQ